MAPFTSPDVIIGCYANRESLKSRGTKDENIVDLFFLNIEKSQVIDGKLSDGGKIVLEGRMGNYGNASKFKVTLSDDSFELANITNSGHTIILVGKKTGYVNSYFGDYSRINTSDNKIVPLLGGVFQASFDHVFKKYNLS
jgi:hypothetical protein